jgi:hypothetical protein
VLTRNPLAVPVGKWRKVQDLIEFFVLNGCVLNDLPGHLEGPDGAHPVRFLYNPETDDFVSLSNLNNEDMIPESIYRNWERRLGFKLPDDNTH